ncbi:uncharacterized protein METZ01_LOCUS9273 [marine metagenome]|uniref:Uncharacterized protein n=1 Tax=marine metagenome TaxID=408172 RepID=A0A381NQ33_9ZZZZ
MRLSYFYQQVDKVYFSYKFNLLNAVVDN